MKLEIENVEQVVNRLVKDGKITGMTEWNDKTVKILIMKDNDA